MHHSGGIYAAYPEARDLSWLLRDAAIRDMSRRMSEHEGE
jgi:hypothetical protein